MANDKETTEAFEHFANDIPGFIAASLVDLDSGMTLAVKSARPDFDLAVASAYNSELVKQKLKIMKALDLKTHMEDMIITLGDQIHFLKIVSPTVFIYLAADRANANIAIVRTVVNKHAKTIQAGRDLRAVPAKLAQTSPRTASGAGGTRVSRVPKPEERASAAGTNEKEDAMDIDGVMEDALRSGPGALAIACADVRAGFVLGASARGEAEREAAANAAACAAQLCSAPIEGGADDGIEDRETAGALVVSSRWIHAYARVAKRPELVVVGVARGDANVVLLLDPPASCSGSG
jgi:hypothetical protein